MDEKLREFEENRKKIYKEHKIFLFLAVLLVVIGIGVGVALDILLITIGLIVVGVILVLISANKVKTFSKSFKNQVVKIIIDSELDGAVYEPSKGFTLNEVLVPGFFKKPDRFHSEDYLRAKYEGVTFEAADIVLKEERIRVDAQGNRHKEYVTYFKGRFIIIDYLRELNLIVKCLETTSLGANNRGLTPVETESIAFNKKFKTFASTPHDAFYILTPPLQEKMLELEKMFGGSIFFGFIKGKFYLAINDNSDSFDIRISKAIDEKFISKIKGQINLAPAIIKEFKLDADKFNNNL